MDFRGTAPLGGAIPGEIASQLIFWEVCDIALQKIISMMSSTVTGH